MNCKQFEICFLLSTGDFSIDAGSGYIINAEDKEEASHIAKEYQSLVYEHSGRAYYDYKDKDIRFISMSSKFSCDNNMKDHKYKFQISKSDGTDFDSVSEKEFCIAIEKSYAEHLKSTGLNITFECVAYKLREVNECMCIDVYRREDNIHTDAIVKEGIGDTDGNKTVDIEFSDCFGEVYGTTLSKREIEIFKKGVLSERERIHDIVGCITIIK